MAVRCSQRRWGRQPIWKTAFRRLLVNAAFWCVGLENKIPDSANVAIVGEFKPSPFKFDGHKKNVKPADFAMQSKQELRHAANNPRRGATAPTAQIRQVALPVTEFFCQIKLAHQL